MPVTTAAHRIAATAQAEYDGESVCVFYRCEGSIHSDWINKIIE